MLFCRDSLWSSVQLWKPIEKKRVAGKVKLSARDRLCIFSHFDKHNLIDAYIIESLKALNKLDCAIIFVSACAGLDDEEVAKISPFVAEIIIKQNLGRDFGSWKVGLDAVHNLDEFSQVVLINDSVYGPLYDLQEMFDHMEQRNLDLWAVTDSWERAWHLQSYFMVCESRFFKSEFFRTFWQQFRFIDNKEYCINHYEVGLSQRALRHNLKLGVYCDYNQVLEEALLTETDVITKRFLTHAAALPINISHFCWKTLIEKFRCPFLKIELLRDNPSQVLDTGKWRGVLTRHTDFNVNVIDDHLKRVMTTKKITRASWLNKQYTRSISRATNAREPSQEIKPNTPTKAKQPTTTESKKRAKPKSVQ
jgi:rhamnosyltransferase